MSLPGGRERRVNPMKEGQETAHFLGDPSAASAVG